MESSDFGFSANFANHALGCRDVFVFTLKVFQETVHALKVSGIKVFWEKCEFLHVLNAVAKIQLLATNKK